VCSAELAFETMTKLLLRAFPMHDNPLTVRYNKWQTANAPTQSSKVQRASE
jgi:hypothetical protein